MVSKLSKTTHNHPSEVSFYFIFLRNAFKQIHEIMLQKVRGLLL